MRIHGVKRGHQKITRGLLCASAATFGLVYAAPSWAQSKSDSVETVTVTAEKRSENLQQVPMAVSAISGEKLQQLGLTSIADIAPLLPSLSLVTAQNNRNAEVQIRDFGTGGANPGIEQDVGIYIDGLYQPLGGGTILSSLVDIKDVEVLAGPQGTLYGRNTSAGALVVTTAAPSQTTEAMVDVTAGNFGYERFQGVYSGGITNDLAGRITIYGNDGNNWMHDITTGSNVGGQTEEGGRLRLLYTPTSDLTVNVIGAYDHLDSSCCDWQIAQFSTQGPYSVLTPNFLASQATLGIAFHQLNYNDRDVDSFLTPVNSTQIAEAEVQADYATPWGPTLTSVTGFNFYDGIENIQPIGYQTNNEGYQTQVDNTSSESEELRLTSPSGGWLEYMVGLYGYHQYTHYINNGLFFQGANLECAGVKAAPTACLAAGDPVYPPGFGTSNNNWQSTDSAALFAQVKITPFDHFHLIGGARLNYTDKQAALTNVDFGVPGTAGGNYATAINTKFGYPYTTPQYHYSKSVETWLATAQYDITDDVMAYVTASTGFKDGGFNLAKNIAGAEEFAPQFTFDYEVGAKTSWFEKKIVLNMDVFFMKSYGYQQSVFDGDIIGAGGVVSSGFIVGNAGNVSDRGYEATLTAKPIDPLSIIGNISLADQKFSNYSAATCETGPLPPITPKTKPGATTCSYNGFTPAYAPRMHWSIEAEWEQGLDMFHGWNWFVEGDVAWTGSEYIDATLDPPSYQGAYALLNSRVGVETDSGKWRLMFWGKNLTNRLYYVTMTTFVSQAEIQGATPYVTPNGYSDIYGPPRTFGVEGTYRF